MTRQRWINYTDEGSGPVFVFVHAGMWSIIWREPIAALRCEFRCITMDLPGAGLSCGGRSKMGVGRHYDRADKQAFFGPYRQSRFARHFHHAMRSARQSVGLYDDCRNRASAQLG